MKASEPKSDRVSNALLTAPAIHGDLKPLFDAVVTVIVASQSLAEGYCDLLARKASDGLPTREEWPDSPEIECDRADHATAIIKRIQDAQAECRERVIYCDYVEPDWTRQMRRWSADYLEWCGAIATARHAAHSPAVAAIMDGGEAQPAKRWTTQTIVGIDRLAALLHPLINGGHDGLGFIRCGVPPFPADFPFAANAIGQRLAELRATPISAVSQHSSFAAHELAATTPSAIKHTTVVLWEGAMHTPHNTRLARSRTAYQENAGKVSAAVAALNKDGHRLSRRAFYNHLQVLDQEDPGWREKYLECTPVAKLKELHGMQIERSRGKSRDKVR
jgi:hypothetical protein